MNTGKLFLGFDPGMSGGLCSIADANLIKEYNWKPVHLEAMPDTLADLWNTISRWTPKQDGRVLAVVEKVGGYAGGGDGQKGGGAANGSAMFKFGVNNGALRMALTAAGIPFEEVVPRTWQKEFGIARREGEEKHKFKSRIKQVAQSLFPKEQITLKTCDAILIAEYCRRKYGK